MAGYLQLAQAARAAHARIRTAQELEARWKALDPGAREEARAEWASLKTALAAVRNRLTDGPKGFVRGFGAGYRGEEVDPVPESRPLIEVVRDLHAATDALRTKLEALPDPGDAPNALGGGDP
ncbi:hypothetical protein [Patulibacter minatonensis]|uniref:hypothetical protein n=1 Tax=Patulibacter minatonensis TaxID=298163 RepID=UPI000479C7A7|nr:hypothetical protein [Patulibacter minatonensis]